MRKQRNYQEQVKSFFCNNSGQGGISFKQNLSKENQKSMICVRKVPLRWKHISKRIGKIVLYQSKCKM